MVKSSKKNNLKSHSTTRYRTEGVLVGDPQILNPMFSFFNKVRQQNNFLVTHAINIFHYNVNVKVILQAQHQNKQLAE